MTLCRRPGTKLDDDTVTLLHERGRTHVNAVGSSETTTEATTESDLVADLQGRPQGQSDPTRTPSEILFQAPTRTPPPSRRRCKTRSRPS